MRYDYTPFRITKIKKIDHTKYSWRYGGIGTSNTATRNVESHNNFGKSFGYFLKSSLYIIIESSHFTPGIYPREMKVWVNTNTYKQMLIGVWFVLANNWCNPNVHHQKHNKWVVYVFWNNVEWRNPDQKRYR